MTLPEQILLALKNVVRAGTRTVLCVLAICIGITSVNLIVSIGGMAGESIQSELEQIGVRGVALYTKTGVSFSPEAPGRGLFVHSAGGFSCSSRSRVYRYAFAGRLHTSVTALYRSHRP